jgi:hypothetical protein
MEIEEEFAIDFPDRDAETIQTVGQLIDYVVDRLRARRVRPCPSQANFHVVRRIMMSRAGTRREDVRLGARLSQLTGGAHVLRGLWPSLQAASFRPTMRLGTRWSKLQPALFLYGFVLTTIGAVMLAGMTGLWALGALFWFSAMLTLAATMPRVAPISPDSTVRDLVRHMTGRWQHAPIGAGVEPNAEHVALRVSQIVAEQTGLEIDAVRRDRRFIGDLF